MPADLAQFLSSGKGQAASAEKLELLGKEAADRLLTSGIPLQDSVMKIASESPDLNSEQIRRVVEFANTSAYLGFHDKAKSAGAGHSYPQFDLADADQVLDALGSATSLRLSRSIEDPSYCREVPRQKISNAKLEDELERMFLGDPSTREKTASLDFSYETGVHEIISKKEDLVSLKDNLTDSAQKLDLLLKQAEAEYYDAVKSHMLDGGSFADVARGASEVLEGEDLKEALVPVMSRLFQEKVAAPDEVYCQLSDLEKVAHRIVDQDHPFVKTFGAVVSFQHECEKVATAILTVEDQLQAVKQVIKEDLLAAAR
jgi:hypothetical protein